MKTAADWNLSIESMLEFRDNLRDGGGRGLDYEDYLKMLIFMKNENKTTLRLMDIMEMNIRQTPGNAGFKMDDCVDIFRADFKVSGKNLRNYGIERVAGYE